MLPLGTQGKQEMMVSTPLQMLTYHFPRRRTPQAKPVVPRHALPHSNSGHPLDIPVIPTIPVDTHTSAIIRNTRVPAGSHIRIRIWSLLSPLMRLLPSSPHRLVNRRTTPATPQPTTTSGVRACSARFLHPPDGIRRRVILWNWCSRHMGSD